MLHRGNCLLCLGGLARGIAWMVRGICLGTRLAVVVGEVEGSCQPGRKVGVACCASIIEQV